MEYLRGLKFPYPCGEKNKIMKLLFSTYHFIRAISVVILFIAFGFFSGHFSVERSYNCTRLSYSWYWFGYASVVVFLATRSEKEGETEQNSDILHTIDLKPKITDLF